MAFASETFADLRPSELSNQLIAHLDGQILPVQQCACSLKGRFSSATNCRAISRIRFRSWSSMTYPPPKKVSEIPTISHAPNHRKSQANRKVRNAPTLNIYKMWQLTKPLGKHYHHASFWHGINILFSNFLIGHVRLSQFCISLYWIISCKIENS